MSSGLAICRCTIADAPALTALARRTFYDTFTGTCTEADMQDFLDTFYNEARIAQELGDAADHTFFALRDDVPIGFLRFLESDIPFPHSPTKKALELNRLYVDLPYKGQGVAHKLMDFYMDCAKAGAYHLLWLGVWEHNYRAQAFYSKYGFEPTTYTHPFPIGNTPQTDVWWIREV